MENPLFSVIITTKNEERYLERTLRSIKNQTYKPIEIIVSDAKSTDGTLKISKKFVDKIILKKTNIPAGRNLGAKYARGKYLVFVDADCILARDWVEKSYSSFERENADLVNGSFEPIEKTMKAKIFIKVLNGARILSNILGLSNVMGPGVVAIKKETFTRVRGYRENLAMAEEEDLGKRVNKIGKIFYERNCKARTSFRRMEKDGYLKWSFVWLLGYLMIVLGKKPITKTYRTIR